MIPCLDNNLIGYIIRSSEDSAMSIKTVRACIYARKSNDDRHGGESNSVKEQTADCLAVISREGWELVRDGRELAFADDGITGRTWPAGAMFDGQAGVDDATNEYIKRMPKKRRPGFGRLLEAVKRGDIDVVVVRDHQRIARPVFSSDLANFIPNFLKRHSVSVYSIADGHIDYRDFSTLIIRFLSDAMLDKEMKTRAQHSKNAVEAIRNAGNYIGRKSIFGLDWKNDELVPNERAYDIKTIFTKVSRGTALSEVARMFYHQNIKTRNCRYWSATGIRAICENPLYAGLTRTSNGLVRCKQVKTPIVPASLFHAVSDILSKRKGFPNRSTTSGGIATGLLYCGHCGIRFTIKTSPHNRRYACARANVSGCKTPIRMENIDKFLLSFYPLKPLVEADKNREYQREREQLPQMRKDEQAQLKRIGKFQEAIKRQDGDFEEALSLLKQMKDELTRIQRKIATIETLPAMEEYSVSTEINMDADINEKRQFLKDLFSKIIIHEHHIVFHLVSGESFTVKRTNGRYRWLHIPLLFEHGAPQARFPNIRIYRSSSPLTHLMYFIDPKGLDKPVTLLGGKLHITPVKGKLPKVEVWGRTNPKLQLKNQQKVLQDFLIANFPEYASEFISREQHTTVPYKESFDL